MDDNTFTDFFKVGKGNPLSCVIFILVIEILLLKLKRSQTLSPLSVALSNNGQLYERSLGFADDINCLVNNNEMDLKNLKSILDEFGFA